MSHQQLLPLARSQRDLWMAERVSGPSAAYSMMASTEMHGPVNVDCWQKACQHVLSSTQALRLKLVDDSGEVKQVIRDDLDVTITFCDLSTAAAPEDEALRLIRTLLETPFTTADDRLFRWGLIKQAEEHYYYVEAYHHIILDGFCGWQVSERIKQTYANLTQGLVPPGYPFQGLDVVLAKESAYLATEQCRKDRAFWLEALQGADSVAKAKETQLTNHSVEFHRVTVSYDHDETQAILNKAEQFDSTPANLITAAAALMVSLQQNSAEVMLGTMQLGRSAKSAADDPLFMANRSCLLFDTRPEVRLTDLVAQVKTQVFRSLRRQNYRYEDLRHDLGLSGQNPDPFDLVVNNMPFVREVPIPGVQTRTTVPCYGPVSKMGLAVLEAATAGQFCFVLDGNCELYTREAVEDYAKGLDCILRALVTTSGQTPLGEIVYCDQPTYVESQPAPEITLDALLRQSFAHHADSTAIATSVDGCLTYSELDRQSNAIANKLIQLEVSPSTVVAVSLPRRPLLAAALLGVIKSGAICLPLDANYPAERTRVVLQESRASVLIVDNEKSDAFVGNVEAIVGLSDKSLLDICDQFAHVQPPAAAVGPSDIALLTFTSGSTGTPKGVPITNRGLVNRLLTDQDLLAIDSNCCFAHTSSIVFDAALFYFLIALVAGGTCVLYKDEEIKSFDQFWGLAQGFSVTHLVPAPTLASSLLRKGMGLPASVKAMLLGGEVLPTTLAADYMAEHPQLRIFNLYGPAEACIQVTLHEVTDLTRRSQPIGRALPGCEVYVLDPLGRRMPPGVTGEICLGGFCLMPGYWLRPDLTAQKFIPNALGDGSDSLYRTGDLGYIGADGLFYFVGRTDRVVKRNGVRIEIGDIEHSLNLLAGVGDAAVCARSVGLRKLLIGYVTLDGDRFSRGADIKSELAKLLPSTMLPDSILILEDMPRLPSNKINYNALPNPVDSSDDLILESPVQRTLCDLFTSIAGVQPESIDQSLFDLGGDSLAILRLEGEIYKRFSRQVSLQNLFADPTIRSIAEYLETPAPVVQQHPQVSTVDLAGQQSDQQIWCIPAVSGLAMVYQPLAVALAAAVQLVGLQSTDHQFERPATSVAALAEGYVDWLSTRHAESQSWLLGWSLGGVVAHEIARQLAGRQHPVAGLILLDSYFDSSAIPDLESLKDVAATSMSMPDSPLGDTPSALNSLAWLQRFGEVDRSASLMIKNHHPGMITAPLVYVRAFDNQIQHLPSTLAQLTAGPISIQHTTIAHFDMERQDAAVELARAIQVGLASVG